MNLLSLISKYRIEGSKLAHLIGPHHLLPMAVEPRISTFHIGWRATTLQNTPWVSPKSQYPTRRLWEARPRWQEATQQPASPQESGMATTANSRRVPSCGTCRPSGFEWRRADEAGEQGAAPTLLCLLLPFSSAFIRNFSQVSIRTRWSSFIKLVAELWASIDRFKVFSLKQHN